MDDFLPIHLSVALLPANHWTFAITLFLKDDQCCHNSSLLNIGKVFKELQLRPGYRFSLCTVAEEEERIVWTMYSTVIIAVVYLNRTHKTH